MNTDNIWPVVFLGAVIASLTLRISARKNKRIYIPDYQRAVRFVDGSFVDVLGPGSYQPDGKREQITVVDMRPQPIVLERVFYQDATQAPSVISIGAELVIADPCQAITKLKNLANDSIAIIRDELRITVSKRIADVAAEARGKMGTDIAESLNTQLIKFGVQVKNVEVTELWSRPVNPAMIMGAN
jgi:hypothetical protein